MSLSSFGYVQRPNDEFMFYPTSAPSTGSSTMATTSVPSIQSLPTSVNGHSSFYSPMEPPTPPLSSAGPPSSTLPQLSIKTESLSCGPASSTSSPYDCASMSVYSLPGIAPTTYSPNVAAAATYHSPAASFASVSSYPGNNAQGNTYSSSQLWSATDMQMNFSPLEDSAYSAPSSSLSGADSAGRPSSSGMSSYYGSYGQVPGVSSTFDAYMSPTGMGVDSSAQNFSFANVLGRPTSSTSGYDQFGMASIPLLPTTSSAIRANVPSLTARVPTRATIYSRSGYSDSSSNNLSEYGRQNQNGTWSCNYPNCTSKAVFNRGCDLRKHFKRHRKTFFCSYKECPQSHTGGFSSKKDLARHEAKHKPDVNCEWHGCTRVFSRVDNMRDHVKRIHHKAQRQENLARQAASKAANLQLPGLSSTPQSQQQYQADFSRMTSYSEDRKEDLTLRRIAVPCVTLPSIAAQTSSTSAPSQSSLPRLNMSSFLGPSVHSPDSPQPQHMSQQALLA